MYSRYTPNAQGGFDRRRVPDPAERPAQTPQPAEPPGPGSDRAPPPAGPSAPELPPQPGAHAPPPAARAGRQPPGRSAPGPAPGPGLPPGPGGLLSRLLPRGLDAEELLVLAVLLLAMKQDGAATSELLIAAGLYLFL